MLHVICGAPCSGKTTYISEHAGENDLIIDADKIANAFGGSEYHAKGEPLKVALDSRELAIKHALKSDSEAWLIDTLPSDEHLKQYAEVNADVVLLDTPYEDCIKRAEERPEGTKEAIDRWFQNVDDLKRQLTRRKKMETVKQEATEEIKTFTQEEVNGIINDRLARERKKYEGIDIDELKRKAQEFDQIEEANKSELEKANERAAALQSELEGMKKANEIRAIREKVATETGVPMNLLTAETEEECTEQANAIKAFAIPTSYPSVKDGGEVQKIGKQSTKQQFAEWANKAFG